MTYSAMVIYLEHVKRRPLKKNIRSVLLDAFAVMYVTCNAFLMSTFLKKKIIKTAEKRT